MKRILIVKITSLGDVVLAQPVVTDVLHAFPDVQIDWATDGAYADIPGWNPGVSKVFSAPLRQFKRMRNRQGAMAILRSIKALREHRYDAIIDIHGAYKSAIVSFLARAKRRYGYENRSLGERGAAFAYSHRMHRPKGVSAVQGMRASAAHALGYELTGPAHYNLKVPLHASSASLPADTVLFLHGASKAEKNWPFDHWVALGKILQAKGLHIALPWSSDEEFERATRIVEALPGATVLPKLSLTDCAKTIASAALIVGVDTGLTHLAHAFSRPAVMIFMATSRNHYGIAAEGLGVSVGDSGDCPSVDTVLNAVHQVLPHKDH